MDNDTSSGILKSVKLIRELLQKASNQSLSQFYNLRADDIDNQIEVVEFYMERAYSKSLVLLDQLEMSKTYKKLEGIYDKAKKNGFAREKGIDQEPYLIWRDPLEAILDSILDYNSLEMLDTPISRDLISIIRGSEYSITNKKIFKEMPQNENDVHQRIEGILKCIFPDLQNKPRLTKPIKSFEPDTGLPSIKTLIEYKYISTTTEAKRIADEILADSRGYTSNLWNTYLYVIYETHRVKSEDEWNQFIASCEISKSSKVVVLHGEATEKSSAKNNKKA